MTSEVYSIPFERDGYLFSMHVISSLEQAEFMADTLGLGEPELVNAIIPNMTRGMN